MARAVELPASPARSGDSRAPMPHREAGPDFEGHEKLELVALIRHLIQVFNVLENIDIVHERERRVRRAPFGGRSSR